MYTIIVGGGHVGYQLAKRLLSREHEVLLIEKKVELIEKLAFELGENNVLLGDGCEVRMQKEAGFGRADIVVAATNEDEDNLVVCQMAKHHWNVQHVIARIKNPSYETLFHDLGVDDTVSATNIIFSLFEQQIELDEPILVGTLAGGTHEVIEVELSSRSSLVTKVIGDIVWPEGAKLVWLCRNEKEVSLGQGVQLLPGDRLAFVVFPHLSEELRCFIQE